MILLVVQAAALAVLVTQGSIFDKLREIGPQLWRDLLTCPLCFGTWTGMLGAVLLGETWRAPWYLIPWWILSTGALSGCLAWLFSAVIERLEGVSNEGDS